MGEPSARGYLGPLILVDRCSWRLVAPKPEDASWFQRFLRVEINWLVGQSFVAATLWSCLVAIGVFAET